MREDSRHAPQGRAGRDKPVPYGRVRVYDKSLVTEDDNLVGATLVVARRAMQTYVRGGGTAQGRPRRLLAVSRRQWPLTKDLSALHHCPPVPTVAISTCHWEGRTTNGPAKFHLPAIGVYDKSLLSETTGRHKGVPYGRRSP